MQRSADRIMNGLKGGDLVMESREAEHAVLHAQDSATGVGMTRLQPRLFLSSRIRFFRAKKGRTLSMRVRQFGEALVGRWGVDSVHTFGVGLGRASVGLARIPYVSAGVQCLQGLEPGSSPTSGTCFPCSGAFWCFFVCTLCTLPPLI